MTYDRRYSQNFHHTSASDGATPHPKKSLGQVLLRDRVIARRIAEAVPKDKFVVEIGPGDGALTTALLETGHQLMAVEIDSEMVEYLLVRMKNQRNFQLLSGDILKVNWESLGAEHPELVVTGNLPYHLVSEILFALFEHLRSGKPPFISRIVFMVQKEVGLRLCSSPGNKVYGSITVLARYHGKPLYLFTVPADRFYPVPQVDGAVIAIDCYRPEEMPPVDYKLFRRFVRGSFAQRRKMMRNSIRVAGPLPAGWEELDYDFSQRAERFTFDEFVHLSVDLKRLMDLDPISQQQPATEQPEGDDLEIEDAG